MSLHFFLWEGPEKKLEIKKLDLSFMDNMVLIDLHIFIIAREIKSEKYEGGKLP